MAQIDSNFPYERNSSVTALISLLQSAEPVSQELLEDMATFTANRIIYHAQFALDFLQAGILSQTEHTMKRTEPYTGPFPRKRHSHRCIGCEKFGQINAVACYKSQCTKPQLTETCSWCSPSKVPSLYR